MTYDFEDVLHFWFPVQPTDHATAVRQFERWFRGGADAEIIARFGPLLEAASSGALDRWADTPRSRLALILVLDQFPRSIHRGTALAFAHEAKVLALARAGIANGHYAALETPWEKMFVCVALAHSEDLASCELCVTLTEQLAREAEGDLRQMHEFSAGQARGHRDVIARYGRHPHRNQVLGRESTPEELEYIKTGKFVHTRDLPPV